MMKTFLVGLLVFLMASGGVALAASQVGFLGLNNDNGEITEAVADADDQESTENGTDTVEVNGIDDEDGIEDENGTANDENSDAENGDDENGDDERSDVAKDVHRALTADPEDPDDEGLKPGDEGFGQAVAENARTGGAAFGRRVAAAASGRDR